MWLETREQRQAERTRGIIMRNHRHRLVADLLFGPAPNDLIILTALSSTLLGASAKFVWRKRSTALRR